MGFKHYKFQPNEYVLVMKNGKVIKQGVGLSFFCNTLSTGMSVVPTVSFDTFFAFDDVLTCFCKAGYMLRDWDDSGQVYEPKTVKSAYLVNCESTFAYLFGIDLFTNEFVWLNVAKNSKSRVAGDTNLSFLTDYFHLTDVMNMYDFFSMMAEKIVEDPMEADVVVTDHEVKCTEEAQIIREYDFEKIQMLMEDAK